MTEPEALQEFDAEIFCNFTALREAQKYLYGLPFKERLKVWTVIPSFPWKFANQLDDDHPLYKVKRKDAQLYLGDGGANGNDLPSLSTKEAAKLYRTIYNLIKTAKEKADTDHLPLHIVVGEYHASRNDLLITNMITEVAKSLDIHKIGIEGGNTDVDSESNFENYRKEAMEFYKKHYNYNSPQSKRNKFGYGRPVASERSETSNLPQRKEFNQVFQWQAALEAGYSPKNIFDASPLRNLGEYDQTHAESVKVLQGISESCIAMFGGMHLPDIMNGLNGDDSARTLFINTSLCPYNWGSDFDNSRFADAKILDDGNVQELAEGGQQNFMQIMTPGGQIHSADKVFKQSRAAKRIFDEEERKRKSSDIWAQRVSGRHREGRVHQ